MVAFFALLPLGFAQGIPQADQSLQFQATGMDFRGRIENAPVGAALRVELLSLTGQFWPARTDVQSGGDFAFGSVPAGDYRLRVLTLYGDIVYQGFVTVGNGDSVEIRLPRQKVERPPSGSVSIQRLQHKVPGKAVKELKKAQEASDRQDFAKAIGHLQKAITLDPGFLEAHNNLGVCYLRLHQFDQALAEFQTASKLDPDDAAAGSNLGIVLLDLGRYSEAETVARQALKSDSSCQKARFVLALSLKARNLGDQEALADFRQVADEYPRARLAAAEILAKQNHRDEAASELQLYLRTADSKSNRQQVESWLARLQR
jgi:tetratricopeptide (TPR) repeat protein